MTEEEDKKKGATRSTEASVLSELPAKEMGRKGQAIHLEERGGVTTEQDSEEEGRISQNNATAAAAADTNTAESANCTEEATATTTGVGIGIACSFYGTQSSNGTANGSQVGAVSVQGNTQTPLCIPANLSSHGIATADEETNTHNFNEHSGASFRGEDTIVTHTVADVENVAVATLVENPVSVHAEEVVPPPLNAPNGSIPAPSEASTPEDKASLARERRKTLGCATLAFLVVLVAVVLAVVLTRRNQDASTPSPTPFPASSPPTVPPSIATSTAPPTTAGPTSAPTTQAAHLAALEGSLSAILANNTAVSSTNLFEDDPSASQAKAFQWLVQDQYIRPLPLHNHTSTTRILQRYVLAVLYFATGGDHHWLPDLQALHWLDHERHECAWTDPSGLLGVKTCSSSDQVTTLDFSDTPLHGTIPTQLALLTHLGQLRFLDNPALTGSVPSQLGNLKDNLSFLSLTSNSLSGTIPSQLGLLEHCEGVWMHNNALTGTIPESLGEGLGATIWLWLHQNQLTGSVPTSFASLQNATDIWLHENQLTGSVDFLCEVLHVEHNATGGVLKNFMVDRSAVQCQCCKCCD